MFLPSFVFSSGKCMVSSFREYLSCRPTEVPEKDILLCESRYIDSEKQMKKFKGLKRFSFSSKVVEDEIYYFRYVFQRRLVPLCAAPSCRQTLYRLRSDLVQEIGGAPERGIPVFG